MAQPALDFFKRRGVAVKAEVTENVDSVPVAGTNGIMLMNGKSGTEFDKKERMVDRAFFTGDPFSVSNKRAFIEGEFDLYSPSVPGVAVTGVADVAPVLLPCGLAQTLTGATNKQSQYNPISTAIPTVSAYFWHVDTLKKLTGARGNLSSLKMEVGERYKGTLRLQGNYTTVTTQAVPAITLPSTVPPVSTYANSVAYIDPDGAGGGAELLVWCKMLELSFNNALTSKEYTSVIFQSISDRKATWKMRIARTDLADFNPWTVRDAGTIITGRFRTTETGTLYSQLSFRGQIEAIDEVDIDGDYGWELSGPCIASNAGGDEFRILFGDSTGV